MDKFSSIVPLRFRIDESYLRDLAVSFSPFAYEQDCKDFLAKMQHYQTKKGRDRNLPYRRLNTVLTALAPTLAHPFLSRRNVDTGNYERQMLIIGTEKKDRPTPEQISDLVYEWGKQWGKDQFRDIVEGVGKDVYKQFLDRLQQPLQRWYETDAALLFRDLNKGTQLGYQAIPSLFASLMAGKESKIHGRKVSWRLMQDGMYGLAVVSEPFLASYTDRKGNICEGTFAYKLEFRLQTQVGSPHRWIHLYIRCTRYVDKKITRVNYMRDVSVRVGVHQPRLAGWGWSPTLVSLPLTGGSNSPRWDDHLVELLSAMKARDLVSPAMILQEPQKYRAASEQTGYDQYYVVYAEGFRPYHKIKTGFDFAEIQEVAESVSEILGLEISCGQTLVSDMPNSRMYLNELPPSMFDIGDFQKKQFLRKTYRQTKDENKRLNQIERQKIVYQALQRATGNQMVCIFLCWQNSLTKRILEQEIRNALFLDADKPLPETVRIIVPSQPIPDDLVQPLDPGSLDPQKRFNKLSAEERHEFNQEWKKQMQKAFRDKARAWETYLRTLLPEASGYRLALIELTPMEKKQSSKQQMSSNGSTDDNPHASQNVKGAVRWACNKLDIASQVIFPLKVDGDGRVDKAEAARASNSVLDLIYRQTGLVYGAPVELYAKAGIAQEQAKQLSVIGLYKLRKNLPVAINYPIAVRYRHDGTFQVLLPDSSLQWLPLIDARKVLGEVFMRGKKDKIALEPADQAQFAARIFTEAYHVPTLVLLEATDWRNYNVLPQFSNAMQVKDRLDLSHVKACGRIYTPEDLPYLRIIRLRTVGSSGETPQYFPVVFDEEGEMEEGQDFKQLTGFIDKQAESPFFHYFSIGKLPITSKDQNRKNLYKMDEGGGIAFKHQTMVEMVPFFLQKDDDPLAWCRIPHFLRIHPAWGGGNITLPYPLHLAACMLDDQICMLEHVTG
uniref:DUF3893 domain-containing protein n=1 Tax=Thermosporothrix sp. COM3 TaxID=2490863 RepID=A0A455STJ4_9CHLR|nr:hypothetical protein KTC_64480 [Thermosporothrix sp. COM3]